MVKIRVRLGAAEAEVEADPEHIREAIDLIPELVSKMPGASAERIELRREAEEPARNQPQGTRQLPSIALEKSDSLADIIGKFFADPWGRESRKLSDVREALQSYGLNYPKQSVAVALLRLAKTTKLRRFKAEDGEFVYTTSSVTVPSPAG
ncbi:MAG: hypothetical protein LYZ70_05555 [Nitrososphaerales archaeon]|nr:hypothetical protein [Nitrososphaerales archaeon]